MVWQVFFRAVGRVRLGLLNSCFPMQAVSSIEPHRSVRRSPHLQAILIVFELLVAIALIVTILLQRSEGGALGMGGGGSGLGGLFSPRGAADTLTRTTAILAALFFLTCLGLNLLALHGRNEKSFLEGSVPNPTLPAQKTPAPLPTSPSPGVPTPH